MQVLDTLMMPIRRLSYPIARIALGLLALALALPAAAAFPDKPITLVITFPAGGTTDAHGQLLAEIVQKQTGATIIVENKVGAGGSIGVQHAARAKADGYTLLYGSDPMVLSPLLRPDTKVGLQDFIPLVRVRTGPAYLGVNANLPVRDFKER